MVLGLLAALITALIAASPPLVIEAVAGVALLGALAASLAAATADPDYRDAAVVTFVVTASSVTIAGISAPFWPSPGWRCWQFCAGVELERGVRRESDHGGRFGAAPSSESLARRAA